MADENPQEEAARTLLERIAKEAANPATTISGIQMLAEAYAAVSSSPRRQRTASYFEQIEKENARG